METAVFGGGCFWCTEAVFQRVEGVEKVVSGYAGGDTDNPSYDEVKKGLTGHAEVVQISFDPEKVSYSKLLDIFFDIHDPTQLNRQGPDTGSQYRSIILYRNEQQKCQAEKAVERVEKDIQKTVVTEVEALKDFYSAEEYHQDFYSKNPEHPYCRINIEPKLEK